MNLNIVILAAGASSRLGSSKQLLTINEQPLVYRSASIACELAHYFHFPQPLIILGKDQQLVHQAVQELEVSTIYNQRWESGMGTSIATAAQQLENDGSAVLFMTCDQVLLHCQSLIPLIEKWQAHPHHIVASAYNNTHGIPVIFPHSFFSELKQLNSDKGAREILQRHKDKVVVVALPEAAQDLDTRQDEIQIRELLEQSKTSD